MIAVIELDNLPLIPVGDGMKEVLLGTCGL